MLFDEDWIAPLEAAAKDHVRDTLAPRCDADVFASERPERGAGNGDDQIARSTRLLWGGGVPWFTASRAQKGLGDPF